VAGKAGPRPPVKVTHLDVHASGALQDGSVSIGPLIDDAHPSARAKDPDTLVQAPDVGSGCPASGEAAGRREQNGAPAAADVELPAHRPAGRVRRAGRSRPTACPDRCVVVARSDTKHDRDAHPRERADKGRCPGCSPTAQQRRGRSRRAGRPECRRTHVAGEGRRLFDNVGKYGPLDLVSSMPCSNGEIELEYRRRR
jgi:hypothetical protein